MLRTAIYTILAPHTAITGIPSFSSAHSHSQRWLQLLVQAREWGCCRWLQIRLTSTGNFLEEGPLVCEDAEENWQTIGEQILLFFLCPIRGIYLQPHQEMSCRVTSSPCIEHVKTPYSPNVISYSQIGTRASLQLMLAQILTVVLATCECPHSSELESCGKETWEGSH